MKIKSTLKKIIIIVNCALIIVNCTGCWDMKEINTRIFVLGLGVDYNAQSENKTDSEFDFTFVYTVMTEDEIYNAVTISAPSLPQAIRAFDANTGTDANFEHLLCVAIGNEIAKTDFYPVLGCLFSWPAVRRQSLVVASQGRAQELMSTKLTGGNTPSVIASSVEKTDISRTHNATTTLYNLYIANSNHSGFFIYEIGHDDNAQFTIYNAQLEEDDEDVGNDDPGAPQDADSKQDESDHKSQMPRITGALSYDTYGYKGRMESGNAKWLRIFYGHQGDNIVSIQLAVSSEEFAVKERINNYSLLTTNSELTLYFRITDSNCVKSMRFTDCKLQGRIELSLDCTLFDGGYYNSGELSDIEGFYEKSQQKIEENMTGVLRGIIDECKMSLGAAPLGFDNITRQTCSDWFENNYHNMSAAFSVSDIEIEVTCNLRREQA